MTEEYDHRPFLQVRRDIRDIVSIPVMAWLTFGRSRETAPAYRDLLDVPLELAAAGYSVTITQSDAGWCIEVARVIAVGSELQVHSAARSYVSCLLSLAENASIAIDELQARARRQGRPGVAA